MKDFDFPIAKESLPFIIVGSVITIGSIFIGWILISILFFLLTAFTAWFFRNPERQTDAEEEEIILSPADGKIIELKKIRENRFLDKDVIKVSIFMNLFNVHINRIPYTGRVEKISYNHGKFLSANREKASLENEQNAIIIDTDKGRILFIQIAGLIARRIACWIKEGDMVKRGQRFGLIKFSSRVDIFLPADMELRIKKGCKVKAGETILGVLK
ncbi:MAG: phosphatidylserine decarboxylase family protein [Nitrospirota bacterium]